MAELNSTKYIDDLLFVSVKENNLTNVIKLVEMGADINIKVKHITEFNNNTTSLLHIAAHNDAALVCKYLISKGIDPNITYSLGQTPFSFAISGNATKTAELLLKSGYKIQSSQILDNNDFYHAIFAARYKIATLMLKHDSTLAKMVFENDNNNNPFHVIAHHNARSVCKDLRMLTKSLIKYGADINHKNDYGSTPLHYAAHYFYQYTETLLKNGACPNIKNLKGETPLHISAQACTPVSAKALVKHGADLNAVDKYGSIPLFYSGGPVREILIYSRNHKENYRCSRENTK